MIKNQRFLTYFNQQLQETQKVVFTLQPVHTEHGYWQQELDSAIKSIRSKKNLLILGPDKIGKSSFL
ncbi:hypothetical protein KY349_01185, partial [Candidatus Woesearchaeota archaeon]|nr:hypothetical protein [Candidatus Woesearchaeota archaeon]